jgi:type II secretory ATPase GspE/PulE/Tfp pilus assembly ATPase PilB-like protein
MIIEEALSLKASDIHIDPSAATLTVRMRVDGLLVEKYTFLKDIHQELVSRIKILSELRIDEHQTPQDGRFRIVPISGIAVDIRVSILPGFNGEVVVMRLLQNFHKNVSLEGLGMTTEDTIKIQKALAHGQGMVLVTGPTGSGKTTTLYTLLKMLNQNDTSIVTIEDPIEYEIPGVRHIQTNPRVGLTFSNGLRSIVRQDPDIIMVGEIRDTETASIAIHTALTGHLLLSTLHTINAATALPRLMDMHIDPYLIASTVQIVIAQRLVRIFCTHCRGKKCSHCFETGFKGRTGIYEILEVSDSIRTLIMQRAPAQIIEAKAREENMTTLRENGDQKVINNSTSLREVQIALS